MGRAVMFIQIKHFNRFKMKKKIKRKKKWICLEEKYSYYIRSIQLFLLNMVKNICIFLN
jgi:hypothetical protein